MMTKYQQRIKTKQCEHPQFEFAFRYSFQCTVLI